MVGPTDGLRVGLAVGLFVVDPVTVTTDTDDTDTPILMATLSLNANENEEVDASAVVTPTKVYHVKKGKEGIRRNLEGKGKKQNIDHNQPSVKITIFQSVSKH